MSKLHQLVDNGYAVVVFRNQLGSYTSFAVESDHEDLVIAMEDADEDDHLTDDFTVTDSLARLADKVIGCGGYGVDTNDDSE
jgi:hypothetical protein